MTSAESFRIGDMARIARLRLDEGEAKALLAELTKTLAYFSELQKFSGHSGKTQTKTGTLRKDGVAKTGAGAIAKLFNSKDGAYLMAPKSLED